LAARLALLFDYTEEGWPSMDLVAEMLLRGLAEDPALGLCPERVCPPFRRRATRLPLLGRRGAAFNLDRVLNRHWDYPHHIKRRRPEFDLFHVCDHSYAQLIHKLPPERSGVYCHDLDAFRCLLEPQREPRPRWFRALAQRCLAGLQKAAVVFHSTLAVRRLIEAHGLIDPGRLVHAPYGIAEEFHANGVALPLVDGPFLLHVGSCIPRKRIDVLLDVFAALRPRVPGLRLVKVGADWSSAHQEQIERLGLGNALVARSGVTREEIAALYRSASAVLLTSEAEGFGLPIIEALACGAAVVASDLPALREAGGCAAVYCPVGDVAAWVDAVGRVLADPASAPPQATRLIWARQFSWAAHARTVAGAYRRLR
jgi:glycosyltransferase involved in cell wall biosynthesis